MKTKVNVFIDIIKYFVNSSFFFLFLVGTSRIKVMTFEIVGNQLQNLSKSLSSSYIRYLDVSKNKLQFLAEENFNLVSGLSFINAEENDIRRIEADTFKFMRRDLTLLDLRSNKITSINGSVRFLSELDTLILSCNKIEVKYSFI